MGTSFVSIGGNGFWMSDSVLELWLRLLALHVEDPPESCGAATKIRDLWLLASRSHFYGCIPNGLGEATSTEEGATIVRNGVRSLLGELEIAPPLLNKDVLNLLGFMDGTFTRDVETRKLVEVGHAFLDLIDGKITADASDASFMPGST
jgi:hypothetical protein